MLRRSIGATSQRLKLVSTDRRNGAAGSLLLPYARL